MRYVVVYGQTEGYAIGEIESFDTELEAVQALNIEVNKNNKEWKKFWIQKEIPCKFGKK